MGWAGLFFIPSLIIIHDFLGKCHKRSISDFWPFARRSFLSFCCLTAVSRWVELYLLSLRAKGFHYLYGQSPICVCASAHRFTGERMVRFDLNFVDIVFYMRGTIMRFCPREQKHEEETGSFFAAWEWCRTTEHLFSDNNFARYARQREASWSF